MAHSDTDFSGNHQLQGPPAPFDVLIRGGRLLDGLGNPWVHADIGIADDRIGGDRGFGGGLPA